MFLITKLLQAARRWRPRRSGSHGAKRHTVTVEQLDHRQLLSVNFTGNVKTDFPATTQPGVVILNSSTTPGIQHPIIPPYLQPLIPVSGFDLSEIRVSYDAANDTLSVGLNQPPANPANPSSGSVIAGDADDNGNAGTVNPAVQAADPGFTEFFALGGSDTMAAFLDLNGNNIPNVVAGFSPIPPPPTSTDPSPQKPYQVAQAIPNVSNPQGVPSFGTPLPQFAGNVYLFNSASHPNLEFAIKDFSQLYLAETGKALTPSSVIGIGAFAGSLDDIGISDAFFPATNFTLSQATLPPGNPGPSPPILINPHEHRIIDTAHRDLVRVSIFGTSGFPVKDINPATVELDGAHAIAHVTRKVHRDEFPFATYVFVADQLHLPAGLTTATLTGQTTGGVTFTTQRDVLNIPDSARVFGRLRKFMGDASYYKALAKVEARNPATVISVSQSPVVAVSRNPAAKGAASIKVEYTPKVSSAGEAAKKAEAVKIRPVVAIEKRTEAAAERSKVPARLRHSLEHFLK
jgi:hypothetical protein